MIIYLQAFLLGLLGSFHCAGMCGPIAFALPVGQKGLTSRIGGSLLYNAGRILTYSFMGLVLGLLGTGLYFWGIQRWISVALGILMIGWVVVPFFWKGIFRTTTFSAAGSGIRNVFAGLFSKGTWFSVFVIGLLNGFLPCGLVYLALAEAVVSESAYAGALKMFLFGLGTVPVLLGLTLAGNFLGTRFRQIVRKLIPWFIIFMGIIFILRGMNLGIPYISPKMDAQTEKTECCHGNN